MRSVVREAERHCMGPRKEKRNEKVKEAIGSDVQALFFLFPSGGFFTRGYWRVLIGVVSCLSTWQNPRARANGDVQLATPRARAIALARGAARTSPQDSLQLPPIKSCYTNSIY